MTAYSVYGMGLETDEVFPELRPLNRERPRWRFTTVAALEAVRDPVELGGERIYGDVFARLFRHDAGHRITVDDTGTYDLSADRSVIRWQRKHDAWLARWSGADAWFVKPVDPFELADRLVDLIGRHGMQRETA